MTTKILMALLLTLKVVNTYAETDGNANIPKAVLDRHVLACPEFAEEERGKWMTREIHELKRDNFTSSGNKLVLLGCELYAYNSRERAYIVTSYGDITDVAVTEVDQNGNFVATADLMGAGFDPQTQTLGTFVKGRGVGDCGQSATYKYSSESDRFILVEQRLKMECDGDPESDWPVVFPKN